MNDGQPAGDGSAHRGRFDTSPIEQAFRPLLLLYRAAGPTGGGEASETDSDPAASDLRRRRTAHLLVAVSVMWDAVLVGAGVDLSSNVERAQFDDEAKFFFSGYADEMMTYQLCASIEKWNQLGQERPTDDLDREIARALVRIRDVMSAMERGMDIHKRVDEAMIALIISRPASVESMLEEASHRRLAPDIVEQVEDDRDFAEGYRIGQRKQRERRSD